MSLGPKVALLLGSTFVLASLPLLAPACSSSAEKPASKVDAAIDAGVDAAPESDDGGFDALMPPPITRTEGEATLSAERAACTFAAGAWPAQTLGTEDPVGADIPINHIIVIMQENRSFDHYYGRLVPQGYYKAGDFTQPSDGGTADAATANDSGTPASDAGDDGSDDDAGTAAVDAGAGGGTDSGTAGDAEAPGSGFAHSDELDVPPAGWSNPDSDGGIVVPHPDNEYCYGVNHSWDAMHDDLDNGALDHFVTQNNPGGSKTFFYEDDTVIPFYYGLANTFSVGDRYFCSVLSSTWPNRFFLMAATSYGIGDNSFAVNDTAATPAAHIFSLLDQGGHTWRDYTDGPHMVEFFPYYGLQRTTLAHYGDVRCNLMSDITNNTLPDVSFVMGDEVTEDSDEGPSDLPGIGGAVVEQIIRTLFASDAWKDTAVFITYDENGGLADHVKPAPACEPDKLAPHDGNNNPLPGAFDSTGFRVPFTVVSPYARAHFASHVVHDHTSITRFIEARFGLPALTARDANSTPPYEMFDFKNPPFMTPPTISAHTTVPPAVLTQCNETLAPATCTSGTSP